MIILYVLIGLLVGGLGIYLLLRPKLKITQQYNINIEEKNKQLNDQYNDLTKKLEREESFYELIQTQTREAKSSFETLKETQQKAAQLLYDQALEISQNNFDKEINDISNQLEEYREQAKNEYLKTLEDAVSDFQQQIVETQRKLSFLTIQLENKQNDVNLAVEAAQRKMEMETKQDYYRVCLSDEDIAEIKRLREVLPYLRDKTPLNKVIYKVYYERPLTDMIGRVVGSGVHTGIYKITNINSQMCYVGQAANIADRWKQHVKRGVGAEDWTQNKLYPAMYNLGVENFTFEIVEECDRSKLNEREDYWQDYFHAKDFGYSIK